MTHKSLLIGLYNQVAEVKVVEDEFVFMNPTVNTNPDISKNSFVLLKPLLSSGYYGAISIYYNRIDLTTIPEEVTVSRNGALYLNEIIEAIGEALGFEFEPEDYMDVVLPITNTFTLVSGTSSLMFVGTKLINLI